ncbi:MAG TPA: HNH endonuclease, partial [Methanosarcina sp.]|nr:HNH endonuclease [Methanosarcina sp.]
DIPFHHGYRINMLGNVVNLLEGFVIQPTLNKTGYYAVTVRRQGVEDRSITAHIHRLLALTFLPLPDWSLVDELQVNHIDGNKVNNSLTNLEWVTQQRNCQHAYETGLRDDNRPIRIICSTTGKEFVAYSMGEAGRFFGVTAAAVHWQLNCKKTKSPYKGYYVEYADIGPQ